MIEFRLISYGRVYQSFLPWDKPSGGMRFWRADLDVNGYPHRDEPSGRGRSGLRNVGLTIDDW